MLESALARLLNHYLGKYVADLDTENLNVGIFSGDVHLSDLTLKPEALYELNLPIVVKYGKIESVTLQIPWINLTSRPTIVNVDGVYILAKPIIGNETFDAEIEKRLRRATKDHLLSLLDSDGSWSSHRLIDKLINGLMNNLQITINNIHVRYEDDISCSAPLACGLCVQAISLYSTDNKWKILNNQESSTVVYQVIKLDSFSVYWNVDCPSCTTFCDKNGDPKYVWRNEMVRGLEKFVVCDRNLDFLLKPITIKMKMTLSSLGNTEIEGGVRLQMDTSVGDCVLQLSHKQLLSWRTVTESLNWMRVSRQWLSQRPFAKVKKNVKAWWHYAYNAVLEQRIKPYTWSYIKTTRENYRKYRDVYRQILSKPADVELKLDLRKHEDCLSLINLVLAREQARRSFKNEENNANIMDSERKRSISNYFRSQGSDLSMEYYNIAIRLNLAIGNSSLSLFTNDHELLCVHLSQLAFCLDTRPVGECDLLATLQVRSFNVEGSSGHEGHLAPILSADTIAAGYNSPTFLFYIELQKRNPTIEHNAHYRLKSTLETLEFIYNKYFLTELIKFIGISSTDIWNMSRKINWNELLNDLTVNLDLKAPRILICETGCLQKSGLTSSSIRRGGSALVLDAGRVCVNSEGGTRLLPGATPAEVEEHAYDRWEAMFEDAQLLVGDSGDAWRDALNTKESCLHLMPKFCCKVVILNNVKTTSKQLPLQKYNILISSLKLSVSENKLNRLLDLIGNIPLPEMASETEENYLTTLWKDDRVLLHSSYSDLVELKNKLICTKSEILKLQGLDDVAVANLLSDKSSSSDISDVGDEAWAHNVNLPGFEDNVSPSNPILVLFRLVIAESVVLLSVPEERGDRGLLQVRIGRSVFDAAQMSYGPAIQLTIATIVLFEQLHTGPAGHYLELATSGPGQDVLSVLYRKVRADCPDFRTHFRSVETSLVIDVGLLHLVWRVDVCQGLVRYIRRLIKTTIASSATRRLRPILSEHYRWLADELEDPPVPPGAVKFSRSVRLAAMRLCLADADCELLELHVQGFEYDCVFRANDKFLLRLFLNAVTLEDLGHNTLYPKIISMDEDYVLELKYVNHASRINQSELSSSDDRHVMCDGSIRVQFGRLHVVILTKTVHEIKQFVEFIRIPPIVTKYAKQLLDAVWYQQNSNKILLSIHLNGPTLLIPHKPDSPNVIILNTGDLNIENFFSDSLKNINDNILIRIDGINLSRAVMTLAGSLQIQGNLLEPYSIRFDIKHLVQGSNDVPSWKIVCNCDCLRFACGQRDVSTLIDACVHNLVNVCFPRVATPEVITNNDEQAAVVNNLEAFLSQVDVSERKHVSFKVNLDGIQLQLVSDYEEVMSSPVRDMNQGLFQMSIKEVTGVLEVGADGSLKTEALLNNIVFEDIRADAKNPTSENVQTPTANPETNLIIRYDQSRSSDRELSILVKAPQLVLSTSLIAQLHYFIIGCLPSEWPPDGGFENHGYENYELTDRTSITSIPRIVIDIQIEQPLLRITSPLGMYRLDISSDLTMKYVTCPLPECWITVDCFHVNVSLNGESDVQSLIEPFGVKLTHTQVETSNTNITVSDINLAITPSVVRACLCLLHEVQTTAMETGATVPELEEFKLEPQVVENSIDAADAENMWLQQKITDADLISCLPTTVCCPPRNFSGIVTVNIPKITAIVTLDTNLNNLPVLIFKSSFDLHLENHCEIKLTAQVSYYNENVGAWEPLLEPIDWPLATCRPCEATVIVFYASSLPVAGAPLSDDDKQSGVGGTGISCESRTCSRSVSTVRPPESESTGDDDSDASDGEGMSFLRVQKTHALGSPVRTVHDPHESESEGEDAVLDKLAMTLTYLFTSDSSGEENSDSDISSSSISAVSELEPSASASNPAPATLRPATHECSDLHFSYRGEATYIVADFKDKLNFNLTPHLVHLIQALLAVYSDDSVTTLVTGPIKPYTHLATTIGPESMIELIHRNPIHGKNSVICSAQFEQPESIPSSAEESPTSSDRHRSTFGYSKRSVDDVDLEQALRFPRESASDLYKRMSVEQLRVSIAGLYQQTMACPQRTCNKLLRLQPPLHGVLHHAVVTITVEELGRNIVVRAPLQVLNETCYTIGLFYKGEVLRQLGVPTPGEAINPFDGFVRVALLQPHQVYDVPLFVAYHCKLFVQPAHLDCSVSSNGGLWWPDLNTGLHFVECHDKESAAGTTEHTPSPASSISTNNNPNLIPSGNATTLAFCLSATLLPGVPVQCPTTSAVPNHVLALRPPITLRNYLPHHVVVFMPHRSQHFCVDSAGVSYIYDVNPLHEAKVQIQFEYWNLMWTGAFTLSRELEQRAISMTPECDTDGGNRQLAISVRATWGSEGGCVLDIFTPYWIVNRTGLELQIRGCGSDTVHESRGSQTEEPLLFGWGRRSRSGHRAGGRRCARVRLNQSAWSGAFALDAAGGAGRILCRDRERRKTYRALLTVRPSSLCPAHTKFITFEPMFIVANRTSVPLRFMEENEHADLWIDLSPGQSVPFWPETGTFRMHVRYSGSRHTSLCFPIARPHHTVLRMDRSQPALVVDVSGGQVRPFTVAFAKYNHGDAPIRLVNMCGDVFLKFNQRGVGHTALLSPGHAMLYTWDDPSAEQSLVWNVYNNKNRGFHIDYYKDGCGEQSVPFHTVDGSGHVDTQIRVYWLCYMDGVQRTLLFTDQFESFVLHRRKLDVDSCRYELCLSACNVGLSLCCLNAMGNLTELAYVSITDSPAVWEVYVGHKWKELSTNLATWLEDQFKNNTGKCHLKDCLQVDLERMILLKPFFADLKRSYNPALWLQYRYAPTHSYVHVEIQSFQIDNQLDGSSWPNIVHFIPDATSPCFELLLSFSNLNRTVTSCAIETRDLCVQLDAAFVECLLDAWDRLGPKYTRVDRVKADLTALHRPLERYATGPVWTLQQLTVASFNVQLYAWPIVDKIQKYFDVSRMMHKPVTLRITSYELTNARETLRLLASELFACLACSAAQQFYALALGHTVLLNPGFSGGGSHVAPLPGVDECVIVGDVSRGLAEAARRLLGLVRGAEPPHAVYGAAAFPSPMSKARQPASSSLGTAGDLTKAIMVVSALCASGGGQRTRLQGQSMQPPRGDDTAEATVRAACGGLLTLMARQDAVTDCTAVAVDAVRRARLVFQNNTSMRAQLPRHCPIHKGLKPYNAQHAIGLYLLRTVSTGTDADLYCAHSAISTESRNTRFMLISLENLYVIRKKLLWGSWQVDWSTHLDSVVAVPTIEEDTLVFTVTEEEATKMGSDKYKISGDHEILTWLRNKTEEVMVLKIEDEQWCG